MQTEGPPCNALFCVWLCVCVCICVRYLDHRFKIIIRLRLDVRSHVDHYSRSRSDARRRLSSPNAILPSPRMPVAAVSQ